MELAFRRYRREDRDRVLALCVAAFEPIHHGFAQALGPVLHRQTHPDWRGSYARQIDAWPPEAEGARVHVAESPGIGIVAFALSQVDPGTLLGEIDLNAVMPARQGQGIGRRLYAFLLDDLRARGATAAYVGTGGDAAHEPARRAYAAAGFDRAIPALHLYRRL